MVRPTGIELVSSAPQADTLSIELWALKSEFYNNLISYYTFIVTFLNKIYKKFIFSDDKIIFLQV